MVVGESGIGKTTFIEQFMRVGCFVSLEILPTTVPNIRRWWAYDSEWIKSEPESNLTIQRIHTEQRRIPNLFELKSDWLTRIWVRHRHTEMDEANKVRNERKNEQFSTLQTRALTCYFNFRIAWSPCTSLFIFLERTPHQASGSHFYERIEWVCEYPPSYRQSGLIYNPRTNWG